MPRDLVLKALYKSIVGNSEMSPMRSFVGILDSQMLELFVMAVDNSGGGISLEKVGPRWWASWFLYPGPTTFCLVSDKM